MSVRPSAYQLRDELFLSDSRPNIFLTSFFRSGSTHVKETLLRVMRGYTSSTTVFTAGLIGNDNTDVNMFAAQILFPMGLQIFHQHSKGTGSNVAMLKRYKIRPIVQVRNMLDSMVSVKELLATGNPQHLGVYYPEHFEEMTDEQQLWWVVKALPHWYFTFYISWKKANIDKHFIWYDTYYKDQVAGVRGILDHTGISKMGSVSDEAIRMASQVIDPKLSRFKFGLPGRGKELLSPAMIAHVKDAAMAWPEGPELIEQLIER